MYTMNRCLLRQFLHRRAPLLAAAFCLAAALSAPAAAQYLAQRIPPISPAAQVGALVVTAPPEALLDGQAARLSPGARIHDQNNLLLMSAALINQKFLVRYVRDPLGLIHEVWILTAAEAAALSQTLP
jgi:hypothetical protein